MPPPSADIITKVSTEAAQRFVESYYPALQSNRGSLASFYVAPSPPSNDGQPGMPTIVINGNAMPDARSLQTLFETQMPRAHYEVQSYDCQVLNLDYAPVDPGRNDPSPGKKMSLLLMVSGYASYGESGAEVKRGFSESIILVPDVDASSNRGRGGFKREWLIQSQNFRLVV